MIRRLPWWGGYVTAVVALVIVAGLRLAMEELSPHSLSSPFLLFALSIVAAAWTGGFGPGMLATILSIACISYFFLEPRFSFAAYDTRHYVSIGFFALQGLVLSALGESNLRSVRRFTHLNNELETRVEQRTAQLGSANDQLMNEVHERTLAEQRLQVDRNFLAALLESLTNGIMACDERKRITLMNQVTRDLHGLPDGSVQPERWWEYCRVFEADGVTPIPPERLPLFRAFDEGHLEDMHKVIAVPGRPRRLVIANGRAIQDAGGQRIGAVVSFQDVTDRVEAERRMRLAMTELQRSNQELQSFASVASHDLQEPLRKIQAFGDRLLKTQSDHLSEQGRDYLQRMHRAAFRMGVLINDLLAFSRVTTRAQPFVAVDLGEVARDVVVDLEHRLEHSGGEVEVGPLPVIEADPTHMRQLIQNLLSNGLKFSRPGVPPRVRIAQTSPPDDPEVTIEVSDNGIGFDEKYLDRIFGIFQRLHGRGEYEGTGVGLAVCRKIAERHRGRITARSTPGSGATFIVTLPRHQPQGQQADAHPQADHDPARR